MDPFALRHALLRFPTARGRRWLWFERPTETIIARELPEVLPALDAAQAAADAGSWVVGMVSYDAGPAFDPAIASLRDPNVPLVCFGVFDKARPSAGPAGGNYMLTDWIGTRTWSTYARDIDTIKHHIGAGDTYQVNYTMRMRAGFAGDPFGLFTALARAQRAEHLAYLRLGGAAVCSASPELFLRSTGGTVTARPMKGTRRRYSDPAEDRRAIDDLSTSAKDRAENTMIVDMMRNDLGRVAHVGTVEVPALHVVETYPTVHQLTSTVECRTDVRLPELFAATFPGASITGAPKVRTTEIIAALEEEPRGIYTGAIGGLSPDRMAEFNIAIRTVWIDTRLGQAEYGVGGGIVWDSTATDEWDEARDKTRVLIRTQEPFRLLETMAFEPDAGAVLLDRHLARLRDSAEHFGFLVDLDSIRRHISGISATEPQRLRLLVSPDGAFEVEASPLDPITARDWSLPLDAVPVDKSDEFLFHKTTRRGRYEAARARFPDAQDVILWNEKRELTETTVGNLVLELDGALLTPAVASGLLPGTLRAELLDAGTISEASLSVDDLPRASNIWMINSVRGWVPIDVAGLPRLPGGYPHPADTS